MTGRHIVIPMHDFNAGGTEETAFRLAAAWVTRGWKVTILAGASDGRMRGRVPDGVAVSILAPERPRSALSRLTLGAPLARAAAALQPDIIFIAGNFHLFLGAAFKRAMPNVPIVGKISNPLANGTGRLQQLGVAYWTRGIDLLAAMSHGLEADAHKLVPNRRAATVEDPFISDEAPVHDPTGGRKDGLAIAGQPLQILSIGRLEPQKNFALAIAAFKLIREVIPAHLTIAGDGSLRTQLAELVAREGLQDSVTLAGYVPDQFECVRAADMFLISSRYEGGPIVAVEALMSCVPFASTDCSHLLREMVAFNPEFGTLTATNDARGLADAAIALSKRSRPSENSVAAYVARHRIGSAADHYLRVFDGLCAA